MRNRNGRLYSVGDVATICGCSHRTVTTWIDRGHLKGHRLPAMGGGAPRRVPRGTGARRVGAAELLAFLVRHSLPVPPELRPPALLALSADDALVGQLPEHLGLEARVLPDLYQLGVAVGAGSLCVVLLDLACGQRDGVRAAVHMRDRRNVAAVYAVLCEGGEDLPEGLFRAAYHRRHCAAPLAADLTTLFGPGAPAEGGAS